MGSGDDFNRGCYSQSDCNREDIDIKCCDGNLCNSEDIPADNTAGKTEGKTEGNAADLPSITFSLALVAVIFASLFIWRN